MNFEKEKKKDGKKKWKPNKIHLKAECESYGWEKCCADWSQWFRDFLLFFPRDYFEFFQIELLVAWRFLYCGDFIFPPFILSCSACIIACIDCTDIFANRRWYFSCIIRGSFRPNTTKTNRYHFNFGNDCSIRSLDAGYMYLDLIYITDQRKICNTCVLFSIGRCIAYNKV